MVKMKRVGSSSAAENLEEKKKSGENVYERRLPLRIWIVA
jgi:hypothetical protein